MRGTIETFVESGAVQPLAAAYERAVAVHGGRRPEVVVLTHPDTWTPQQIRSLTDAGVRAGIAAAPIVTVPAARAVVDHYLGAAPPTRRTTAVVFDFGDAALDVAVFTVGARGGVRLLAARADDTLGGRSLDAALRRWAERTLAARDPASSRRLRAAPVHVHRHFDAQVRRAKEALSREPAATIAVTLDGTTHTMSLDRAEFETVIAPELDRAVATVRAALAEAGLGPDRAPDVVYATGGSAHVPAVRERLARLGPVRSPADSATVVAEGALIAVQQRRCSSRARALGWLRTVGIAVAAVLIAAGIAVAVSRGASRDPAVVHVSGPSAGAVVTGTAQPGPEPILSRREHSAVPVHLIEDKADTSENRERHE